jgi:hypothetical protein
MNDWPFDDPPNVAVFTVRQIIDDGLPILYVYHDEEDGAWQFLTDQPATMADALLVSLQEILDCDPSIIDLADLPCGWMASRRSREDAWHRQPKINTPEPPT